MPTASVDRAEVLEDAVGVRLEEVGRQDHQGVGAFGLRLPAQRHGHIGSRVPRADDRPARARRPPSESAASTAAVRRWRACSPRSRCRTARARARRESSRKRTSRVWLVQIETAVLAERRVDNRKDAREVRHADLILDAIRSQRAGQRSASTAGGHCRADRDPADGVLVDLDAQAPARGPPARRPRSTPARRGPAWPTVRTRSGCIRAAGDWG